MADHIKVVFVSGGIVQDLFGVENAVEFVLKAPFLVLELIRFNC